MRPDSVVFTRLYHLILEKYGTIKAFTNKIFYNQTIVTHKLRGKAAFTSAEIKAWCAALGIPRNEIPFYFFQDMEDEES